ncbi:DUF642 domain-containing protein [Haloferula sp. A504]|uniref:DUF642 domain-containing protein n=1 Tax=Haloferula sp. A504 TaxID=3373601 RepID=UPI0031BD59F4|nr:DUF642 domain-containing protein [Verrucomicrobiaceae bacterium E54]
MKTAASHVAAFAAPTIAALLGSVHGASLIVNGSFEQAPGVVHGQILESGSTLVTGWAVVDNVPSTSANANTVYMSEGYFTNPAGDGAAFLYIDNNNHPGPTGNGVYQDFTTATGQTYLVEFQAATEHAYGDPALLRVTAGDTTADFILPNLGGYPDNPVFAGWDTYSFTFTATSTTTRLQFFDQGLQVGGDPTNGNASPFIDDVSVTVVPESSSALMVAGVLGLVVMRRRRDLR